MPEGLILTMLTKTDTLSNILKNYRDNIILLSAFLLCYVPALLWMWDRWFARDSYYSHGILIPFVCGYLIWQKKEELKQAKIESSPLGIWLIAGGLGVYLFSSLFRINFSAAFSIMPVLYGLILYGCGKEVFKKVFFPVTFLIFMLPLPSAAITEISFRMKLFAATIAQWSLNSMGLPAVQEGSIIKMRHAYVIVDDVCSGLRSLISLMALGTIFAYWMKTSLVKRVILFLSTVPIAIITNVCRIIFLSFVSEIWGSQYATGFIHDLSGFMVFALAFILLFGMGKLLE